MRQGVPADPHSPPPLGGSDRPDPSPAATPDVLLPPSDELLQVLDGPPAGAWAEEVGPLLADTLVQAVRTTAAYGGVFYLRSADRRSLVISAVAGVPLALLDAFRRIPVAAPLPVAETYRTGRTVLLSGADDAMRRYPRLAVGMPYAYASAAVPIVDGEQVFGVLSVLWPASPAGPPPAARRQLRAAAHRMGAALAPFGERVHGDGYPAAVSLPDPSGGALRLGFFEWDLADNRLSVDDELATILGIEDFDGRGATLLERIVPEDVDLLRQTARAAARSGGGFARQVRTLDPNGGHRVLDLRGRAVGGGSHLVVAVLDAGAAGAAVAAVERLRDGVFALDPEGRLGYLNRSAELLLDTDRDLILGRHPWSVLTWLADPAYEDRYRAAMLSQQPTAFLACRPPDHWLAFSLYPDAHGLTGRIIPASSPGDHRTTLPEAPPPTRASVGAVYHLLQLASALTEAVTVQEVCDCVIDQILPGFGGQEIALYLARSGRMHLVAQTGYPAGFLEPFEGTPLRARLPGTEALVSGAPIFFESEGELDAAYPGITRDEMHAWAFLPLIASGHPVGSCILGFEQRRTFTAEDRAVLSALGGLIAQALERARLYDAEFALARGLQQALLPHRLPKVPELTIAARYLPGTRGMEIGGDWYDAVATAGGVWLVIGDVEGHNVGAAAVMGQLRSAARAFATGGSSPQDVLARTNHLLVDLDAGLLASCCLLRLDPADGRYIAARAGHLPPLLRRADGRTEILDVAGGPLLGIDRSVEYPVTRGTLPAGAIIALYTDGLVERPGTAVSEGIDRLRTTLAHAAAPDLEALADLLLGRASRIEHRADDVALLLTRREPSG
ncbi:SpoIIE family protein phosphatase [Kitasatospora sp. NPDC048365]|uniref:SpoIIE family protein phosphatase n=1 Tax=Kitasatospora sp. NPDC048365 TaxID=3364050 RepID=UPI0037101886